MSLKGITPRVALTLGRTGGVTGARLQVRVEDAELKKLQGNDFDGHERVYAHLKRKDGTEAKVELKYRESVDPAPGIGVEERGYDPTRGPHQGTGLALVEKASGRTVDVHELQVAADEFQLGYGQNVTFSVETNKDIVSTSASPETLWK